VFNPGGGSTGKISVIVRKQLGSLREVLCLNEPTFFAHQYPKWIPDLR
jgi:hypothetical protein